MTRRWPRSLRERACDKTSLQCTDSGIKMCCKLACISIFLPESCLLYTSIQTHHEAHHRGEYPEASGDEAGSGGYRGDGRNRSAQQYHERRPHSYAGRRYISDMPVSDGHTVPVSARRRRERLKRHKKIDRKLQSFFGGSMVA